jgi:hypothetical protein
MRITAWPVVWLLGSGALSVTGCRDEADWREHFSEHPAVVASVPEAAAVLGVQRDRFEGSGGGELLEVRLRLPASTPARAWLRKLESACRRRGERVETSVDRVDLFDPPVSVVYRPTENVLLLVKSVARE